MSNRKKTVDTCSIDTTFKDQRELIGKEIYLLHKTHRAPYDTEMYIYTHSDGVDNSSERKRVKWQCRNVGRKCVCWDMCTLNIISIIAMRA